MRPFCEDVQAWLAAHRDNVAAVHCKAGKVPPDRPVPPLAAGTALSSTVEVGEVLGASGALGMKAPTRLASGALPKEAEAGL